MKELIGIISKIKIKHNNNILYFTAKITSISETHITFIDKFKEIYSYKLKDVENINTGGIKEND